MTENKFWFKFILSGKPQDYLKYKDSCKKQELIGGEVYEHNDRWLGNKGNQYKG